MSPSNHDEKNDQPANDFYMYNADEGLVQYTFRSIREGSRADQENYPAVYIEGLYMQLSDYVEDMFRAAPSVEDQYAAYLMMGCLVASFENDGFIQQYRVATGDISPVTDRQEALVAVSQHPVDYSQLTPAQIVAYKNAQYALSMQEIYNGLVQVREMFVTRWPDAVRIN